MIVINSSLCGLLCYYDTLLTFLVLRISHKIGFTSQQYPPDLNFVWVFQLLMLTLNLIWYIEFSGVVIF